MAESYKFFKNLHFVPNKRPIWCICTGGFLGVAVAIEEAQRVWMLASDVPYDPRNSTPKKAIDVCQKYQHVGR